MAADLSNQACSVPYTYITGVGQEAKRWHPGCSQSSKLLFQILLKGSMQPSRAHV